MAIRRIVARLFAVCCWNENGFWLTSPCEELLNSYGKVKGTHRDAVLKYWIRFACQLGYLLTYIPIVHQLISLTFPFFGRLSVLKKRCVTHHLDCVRICEVKTANPTLPGFYSRVLKFSVLSAMADAIPKTANAKQFFNSDANINSLNHWEVQI